MKDDNIMNVVVDWIPEKVVVGMTKSDSSLGIVSCRYDLKTWTQSTVFERLTGFKPCNQRDKEKQIMKTLTGDVGDVKNDETEGFSVVKGNTLNKYIICNEKNKGVLIHDPRGWDIEITNKDFFDLMEDVGWNVEDHVIKAKLAYGWHKTSGRFKLVNMDLDKSKLIRDKTYMTDNAIFLTEKEMIVGHTYACRDSLVGNWTYLGKHEIFSESDHMNAISDGEYDKQSKFRYVFARIDDNGNQLKTLSGISKVIMKDMSDNVDSSEIMKYCEHIVKTSLLFNKVKIQDTYELEKMTSDGIVRHQKTCYNMFECDDILAKVTGCYKLYGVYALSDNKEIMRLHYDEWSNKIYWSKTNFNYWNNNNSRITCNLTDSTQVFLDAINAKSPIMYLENGQKVPGCIAVALSMNALDRLK